MRWYDGGDGRHGADMRDMRRNGGVRGTGKTLEEWLHGGLVGEMVTCVSVGGHGRWQR